MAKVAVPKRCSTVQDGVNGLQVIVPAKRNFFLMLFLVAWLGGWCLGEVTAAHTLFFDDKNEGVEWFLVFWLMGWTVGGAFAIGIWFWMLAGKERITLGAGTLTVRKEVFGIGRAHEYDLAHVSNLRVSPLVGDPWRTGMHVWGIGGGMVAFDYGAKTFRFGGAIDEAEAAQIVREFTARHAFHPND